MKQFPTHYSRTHIRLHAYLHVSMTGYLYNIIIIMYACLRQNVYLQHKALGNYVMFYRTKNITT